MYRLTFHFKFEIIIDDDWLQNISSYKASRSRKSNKNSSSTFGVTKEDCVLKYKKNIRFPVPKNNRGVGFMGGVDLGGHAMPEICSDP